MAVINALPQISKSTGSQSGSESAIQDVLRYKTVVGVDFSDYTKQNGLFEQDIYESSNLYIFWGDGTSEYIKDPTTILTHQYEDVAFIGTIVIYGDFKGFSRYYLIIKSVIYDNNITEFPARDYISGGNNTYIKLPQSLEKLGNNAFFGSFYFDNVMPLHLSTLEARSLMVNKRNGYSSVEFSQFTNSIGASAFSQSFSRIIFNKVNPPSLQTGNFDATTTILVPQESLKKYKTATNWTTVANKIYPIGFNYSATITIPVANWVDNSATVEFIGSTTEVRNNIDFYLVDSNGNKIKDIYGLTATKGAMQMTFTCETVPTEDISIFVVSTLTNY